MIVHSIEKNIIKLLILLILLFGIYLCYIGGYGSDEDTLPMIHVFEARLFSGAFVSSRFTSYPIPEVGIGFLSHFFGSFLANLFTYLFYLIGLVLIFFTFFKKDNIEKLKFFYLLSLSSPILFFDNLEPIDYSWAFLFFSMGTFFFSRKNFELAVIGFGFAIGCRINFIIFIIIFIYFFYPLRDIDFKRRSLIFLNAFVIGGLFYLPIWFYNGFSLEWITAARPTDQGIFGLFARFSYKSVMTLGLIQTLILFYFFTKLRLKLFTNPDLKLLVFLTISNFLLFFYIPAEKSYLQPAIIFINLILIKQFKKKLILLIIFLNFFSWIIGYDLLKIQHKDNSACATKNAISASFNFKFTKGAINNYLDSRDKINCWIDDKTERGKRILEGKSTRVPLKN